MYSVTSPFCVSGLLQEMSMLLDETLSTLGGSTEAGAASSVVMVVCALVMHPSDVQAMMAKLKTEEQETKKKKSHQTTDYQYI